MSKAIEVITSVERRRRWSAVEKERLVAASLEAGASVSAVARQAAKPASPPCAPASGNATTGTSPSSTARPRWSAATGPGARDRATPKDRAVENWFKLLDRCFDTDENDGAGLNEYRWQATAIDA